MLVFITVHTGMGDRKVFGSGTRLYVTDKAVVEPKLTAYPPSEKHGTKSIMLCQASRMFPDLVKFSWQSKSSTRDWTDLTSDFVEQRDEKDSNIFVTSMLILDKETAKNNNYQCTVEHEGSKVTKQKAEVKPDKVENSEKKPEDDNPNPTCPPSENTKQNLGNQNVDQKPSSYLFVYAYGIMLMKNGVYFVTVCIFLLKRKAGKKDESSQGPSK
ncbi:hypothetical protein E1301_Tti006590 [Triplophysa tibetana]|uniref:Ig-like domain-containing protein n=1 Tax=Triplophysa tibetana TaxID=1572043 RepID=A0A5A9PBE1_9TELE|nr:hypothetical protein E1301_Tti006590 [Triplophysa tibetana]